MTCRKKEKKVAEAAEVKAQPLAKEKKNIAAKSLYLKQSALVDYK